MSAERFRIDPEAETIYIVDDDESVRTSLERLARSMGLQSCCFESAEAFLESARATRFGCVLLDLHLSGMDGLQAFKALRTMGCNMPVIFLTAYGDVTSSVDAMKGGAVDYLLKPIDDNALAHTLTAAMIRYRETERIDAARVNAQTKLATLSRRERDVLRGVLSGKLNKQIAADLGIAEKTVKAHRSRVMEKTESTTVASLVLMCAEAGASTTSASPRP